MRAATSVSLSGAYRACQNFWHCQKKKTKQKKEAKKPRPPAWFLQNKDVRSVNGVAGTLSFLLYSRARARSRVCVYCGTPSIRGLVARSLAGLGVVSRAAEGGGQRFTCSSFSPRHISLQTSRAPGPSVFDSATSSTGCANHAANHAHATRRRTPP